MASIPQDTPQQQCSVCKIFFPATTEYFHVNKARRIGLCSRCKSCAHTAKQRYRVGFVSEERRLKRNASQRAWRKKSGFDINAYNRAGREKSGLDINAYNRAHYAAHREQYQARTKTASFKQRRNQYEAAHREIFNAYRRKRRAGGGPNHTEKDTRDQYRRQNGRCYYCQKEIAWGKHHVDHVIPLSRGGTNDPSNLVIACPSCNSSKGKKLLHEWEGSGGRLL